MYLQDSSLVIFAWGGGKSARRRWLESNHPTVAQGITGAVHLNRFTGIVYNHNIHHDAMAHGHLTQQTLDNWIMDNNLTQNL